MTPNWLIDLDIWINVRFLNGWHNETISSRCGKAQLRAFFGFPEKGDGAWRVLAALIDFTFIWDKGTHCLKKIDYDRGRPAIPDYPDLRWPGLFSQ